MLMNIHILAVPYMEGIKAGNPQILAWIWAPGELIKITHVKLSASPSTSVDVPVSSEQDNFPVSWKYMWI